jgi:DNA anti-recombination protein RmuC
MYNVKETWTDERMDDFAKHVDQRFDGVDQRLDKIDSRFDKIDSRFDKIDSRFDKIDARFEALHRLMLQSSVLVIVALIGLIATQL